MWTHIAGRARIRSMCAPHFTSLLHQRQRPVFAVASLMDKVVVLKTYLWSAKLKFTVLSHLGTQYIEPNPRASACLTSCLSSRQPRRLHFLSSVSLSSPDTLRLASLNDAEARPLPALGTVDSSASVLTDSVAKEDSPGCVLQARYIIRLEMLATA